jgi:hypothetical protein
MKRTGEQCKWKALSAVYKTQSARGFGSVCDSIHGEPGVLFMERLIAFRGVRHVKDVLTDVSEFLASDGVVQSSTVRSDRFHVLGIGREDALKALPFDLVRVDQSTIEIEHNGPRVAHGGNNVGDARSVHGVQILAPRAL